MTSKQKAARSADDANLQARSYLPVLHAGVHRPHSS